MVENKLRIFAMHSELVMQFMYIEHKQNVSGIFNQFVLSVYKFYLQLNY